VDGEANQEVGALIVGVELRWRRAVGSHGPEYFRDAGGAAFGEIQFFEEIADAAVAVATLTRRVTHSGRVQGCFRVPERREYFIE
jgi:hypothetical protein